MKIRLSYLGWKNIEFINYFRPSSEIVTLDISTNFTAAVVIEFELAFNFLLFGNLMPQVFLRSRQASYSSYRFTKNLNAVSIYWVTLSESFSNQRSFVFFYPPAS